MLAVLRPRSDHVACGHLRPADQGHSQETEPNKASLRRLLPPEPIETWHKAIRLLRAAVKMFDTEKDHAFGADNSAVSVQLRIAEALFRIPARSSSHLHRTRRTNARFHLAANNRNSPTKPPESAAPF